MGTIKGQKMSNAVSRREFLSGALSLLGATGAQSTSALSPEPVLEQVTIYIDNLPLALKGFRIGFLTDIHLSAYLPPDLLENALSMISEQRPDLVLFGGDYLWEPKEMLRQLFPVHRPHLLGEGSSKLREIIYHDLMRIIRERLPVGQRIAAVLGNHDHWLGEHHAIRAFQDAQIPLLRNHYFSVTHDGAKIEIYGCDDYLTGYPRLPTPKQDSAIRILLTHNPDLLPWFFSEITNPYHLAMMGHTHGGQVCPLPGVALSYGVRHREFAIGLNQGAYGCQCYTSRGIGWVALPIRVNCPPEVTLFTLMPSNLKSV